MTAALAAVMAAIASRLDVAADPPPLTMTLAEVVSAHTRALILDSGHIRCRRFGIDFVYCARMCVEAGGAQDLVFTVQKTELIQKRVPSSAVLLADASALLVVRGVNGLRKATHFSNDAADSENQSEGCQESLL
ncbi:hypothetical protein Efla_002865 [Eimeria flavescens]